MNFPQTDLTFGLFDLTKGDELASALRTAFIWMQNNVGGVALTPTASTPTSRSYDWPAASSFAGARYAGIRLRYDDTTYSGAGGETITGKFVDATTSDLNVVKLRTADGAQSSSATITTIASNGQFDIVGVGPATITYRYNHPSDDSVILTAVLSITGK